MLQFDDVDSATRCRGALTGRAFNGMTVRPNLLIATAPPHSDAPRALRTHAQCSAFYMISVIVLIVTPHPETV